MQGMEVQLGEFHTEVEAYVLELGNLDMILGVAWLQRFGKVTFDWEHMTISFYWKGEHVELQGQRPRGYHRKKKRQIEEKTTSLYSLTQDNVTNHKPREEQPLSKKQRAEIHMILAQFSEVLRELDGLQPARDIVHSIELYKEARPMSVRSYRYLYHHKSEIEKKVDEMMQQGIIRHNSSAFSSSVILVKKKDASWRLCMDYRELNKVTVPDKYPVSTIEELLDELHRADYFSKLDLKFGYH